MFSMRFRMRLEAIRSFHPAVQVSSYKISVIPQSVYRGDDVNLKVENEVKIPLWLYKKDENENIDDARFFYPRNVGKKNYIICRIPYSFELGFDYDAFFKGNPELFDDSLI